MRIAVVAGICPGNHRALAINTVKTAGGFARLGHDVFVLAKRPEPGFTTLDAKHALREPSLRFVTTDVPQHPGMRTDHPRYFRAFGDWAASKARQLGADLVYSRHSFAARACAHAGLPTVLETHNSVIDDWFGCISALRTSATHASMRAVVTISPVLAERYCNVGADAGKIAVVPDAVDPELFARPDDIGASPFAVHGTGLHVVYAGHLFDYKGVPTMLAAVRALRERLPRAVLHLVGGLDEDRQRVAELARDLPVVLHGSVAHRDVPRYLWHADALLLPPEPDHPSAAWTSPVKLGEYLASRRPIIASDIPALKPLVHEPAVAWFRAGDAASLADAIVRTLRDDEPMLRERVQAELAARYSYTNRARQILVAADANALAA
ncbi:MAG: glycosyltransferase family 4 protein [Planctomycetota bacterium]